MKICSLVFCILCLLRASSQPLGYEKGGLMDSIPVASAPTESYALYLPQAFEQQNAQAVIFVFDPGGRGKLGIKPFIKAAEKYGLILVCSNTCRNSAYEENYAIAERWLNDVFSRFKIDQNRIYAAGFSGGSRLASIIGVLSNAFKGVIGCGAAFSANTAQAPYLPDHFYYTGLVGNLDMNYQEMILAGQWLDKIGLPNQIITFEGDHRWPDAEEITLAFDWFRLQDINNGLSPKDENFLNSYLSSRLDAAQLSMRNNQLLNATSAYERTLEDLGRHFNLDSISTRLEKIKSSKEYRKSLKEHGRITVLEIEWKDKLIERMNLELSRKNPPDDFEWWKKELNRIKEDYSESDNPLLRDMGIRLQNMIRAVVYETMEMAVAEKKLKELNYYALLMQANWPENSFFYFRLARAYASLGDEIKALELLKMAVAKGWNNSEWILRDKVFNPLTNKTEFQLLLDQMR